MATVRAPSKQRDGFLIRMAVSDLVVLEFIEQPDLTWPS